TAVTRTGRGTLTGHEGGAKAVAFSPDGSIIATGDGHGTVRLWDTATRRRLGAPITRPRYECPNVKVAFAPDGRTLAVACLDTVWFWDVATHRGLGAVKDGESVVSALAYSPDGKTLVTGNLKGVVRQWDPATRRPRGAPLGHAHDGPDLSRMIYA